MPSTQQAGDRSDRLRCPKLVEQIGEDPARWLDRDLLADSQRAEIIRTLIDGMDSIQRVRAWKGVEKKLANDDANDDARHPLDEPRAAIMQRLDQREEWLKLHGERADRLPEEIDKSCDCCDGDGFVTAAELRERREDEWKRRSDGYSAEGADTNESGPETEEVGLDAFAATDGGVDE